MAFISVFTKSQDILKYQQKVKPDLSKYFSSIPFQVNKHRLHIYTLQLAMFITNLANSFGKQ